MTEPRPSSAARTHRRSDARRNQEQVVAAAQELFAEHGLGVTVPQVAARAGVGRATVYRSYPTKEDLVAAVAGEHFNRLEAGARQALAAPDAYRGLNEYVLALFDELARNRGLATAFFEARIPSAGKLLDLIGLLLQNAAGSGQVRPDATVRDVRVILCGAVRQLIVLRENDPNVWRRYAIMVLDAFRA
ncbi:TetR/AcrR family transcriptional regulator [Micromonospora pisi]|uniref:TetR/AcrR family transcriptional regulator n=1 Tax=Micromonospora pisi TaxID=589240 RepID=UPI000EB34BE7|nr:TetR/AcrR family transcriptional regulator [Micromonospora pisi]